MADKTTISVYVDEDLVEEFDEVVWERKSAGELHRDVNRSNVISKLMEDYVEGKSMLSSTETTPTAATAD
jgi:metal-responsive CopG/Arc/MetJ family transcriptional regulator